MNMSVIMVVKEDKAKKLGYNWYTTNIEVKTNIE